MNIEKKWIPNVGDKPKSTSKQPTKPNPSRLLDSALIVSEKLQQLKPK